MDILQLPRLSDFHKTEDAGMEEGDHPGHSRFFRFRFSGIGVKASINAARHQDIVFDIVTGNPEFTWRLLCKKAATEERAEQAKNCCSA